MDEKSGSVILNRVQESDKSQDKDVNRHFVNDSDATQFISCGNLYCGTCYNCRCRNEVNQVSKNGTNFVGTALETLLEVGLFTVKFDGIDSLNCMDNNFNNNINNYMNGNCNIDYNINVDNNCNNNDNKRENVKKHNDMMIAKPLVEICE